jgi:hypothetical protein
VAKDEEKVYPTPKESVALEPSVSFGGGMKKDLKERIAEHDDRNQDALLERLDSLQRLIVQQQDRIEKQDRLLSDLGRKFGSIAVPASAGVTMTEYVRSEVDRLLGDRDSARIMILMSEDPAKNYDVDIWVNGEHWRLKRGEVVLLPRRAIEVLINAEVRSLQRIVGPDDNPHTVPVCYMRFPFHILGA